MLMTDTFPSGFSTPLGAIPDAGEPTSDVTSTLAELERKLRELERELTSIGRRRVRPEGEGIEPFTVPIPRPDERVGLAPTGRLVDERVEPTRAASAVQPPPAQRQMAPPMQPTPPQRHMAAPPTQPQPPTHPQPPTPQPPTQPPPRRHAAALSEPPLTSSEERPRPTEAQLAALAELRRFSERLERFAKELTADYEAVLAHVMAVLSGRVPPEPPAPGGPAPEPVAPVSEEPLFEGRVELGVGPFYDIGSLSAFEQQVAGVPNVTEVSVRRFEASHAVVDLRLAAPVALLGELRRVLDTDFGVRQVAPGRIALSFDEP
jgi:hypothetical protein